MPAVITVASRAELYVALNSAKGGERILLKEGDYGSLALREGSIADITFNSNVTIASLNPDKPAVFSGLFLRDVANLTLDNVVFDYEFKAGDVYNLRPFSVNSSTNVTIRNSAFEGDVAAGRGPLADGYGTAIGLTVRDSRGIDIEDNDFSVWWRALTVANSKDVTVSGNDIHDIRSDGMNFADVQGVMIEGNHIHDFRLSPGSGDHPDMIQFWTAGTTEPSTNITIRDNILDIGDGDWTQSIFMRNEVVDTGTAGARMFYRDVLIENNTIYNSHVHGITVGETDGLTIRNNSVLHVPDLSMTGGGVSSLSVPVIRVASGSDDVRITGNVTAGIVGTTGQSDWTVAGNAIVQGTNPFGAGYYGNVFVDSTVQDSSGDHNFVAEPGSLIDRLGAGSSAIQPENADAIGEALFSILDVPGNAAARIFDASLTRLVAGRDMPEANYIWTFSDGTTATGKVVSHGFPSGGSYDATLTVRMPDGSLSRVTSSLTLPGSQIVAFEGEHAAFRVFSAEDDTLLAPLACVRDGAIQLQRTGTVASVAQVGGLRGADDLEINLTLKADQAGVGGEVFRVHGAFVANVTGAGEFITTFWSSDGRTYTLRGSTSLPVNDGYAHDITIRLTDGDMELLIDGRSAATGHFNGTLPTSGVQGLTFGNPWGKINFLGDVQAFSIDVDVADYRGQIPPNGAVVPPSPAPPVVPDADPATVAGPLHGAEPGRFVLDIAGLREGRALIDDAMVAPGGEGPRIVLDGENDYVRIGRLQQYESGDRVAFSVDFTRSQQAVGDDRLVWNHQRIGLTVHDDSISVHVATRDDGLANYSVRDLDLSSDTMHRATVLVDLATDRLQVLYDQEVVLDVIGPDFAMPAVQQRGWMLGTPWNRHFHGEIHDFRVGDQFDFVEPAMTVGLNV